MIDAVLDETLFEYINRSPISPRYVFLGMCVPPRNQIQFDINYMIRIRDLGSNYFIIIQQQYSPYRIPNFTYDIRIGNPPSFREYNVFETEYYQGE